MSFLSLTSLYLVNIQPNLKFHPPLPKFSGSASEYRIEVCFRPPSPMKFAGCAPAGSRHCLKENATTPQKISQKL